MNKLTFNVSDKEYDEAMAWIESHDCPNDKITGGTDFIFNTGSGIGYGVDVGCGRCGKRQDVTAYSNW